MKSKISPKFLLFIVGIIGVALVIFFLAFGFFAHSAYSNPTSLINDKILKHPTDDKLIKSIQNFVSGKQTVQSISKTDLGLPIRLKIPKINVNAAVESVGLTSQGAMGVPVGGATVAWFNLGSRPGENGSAVIAGHFGLWKNGKGSVFDNLYKLKRGDKLYIKDEKGITTTFVVRESRTYNPNADASDIFSSSDGKAHLNLITCEGTWIRNKKTYSSRLVVFTDKE